MTTRALPYGNWYTERLGALKKKHRTAALAALQFRCLPAGHPQPSPSINPHNKQELRTYSEQPLSHLIYLEEV